MKTLNKLVWLLVAAITPLASAQDAKPKPAVKIVKETKVFKLDDSNNVRENQGVHSMRLSPDAENVLYVQQIQPAEGVKSSGHRLAIRNIKIAKDTILPGAPCGSDDFFVAYVSMNPFDAEGKNLVIPIGLGPENEPVRIGKGQMQLGIFNLESGKPKKLDLTGPIIFPSYDATGKNLIVFAMFMGDRGGPDLAQSKIVTSPADKIKFKKIGVMGMPRTPRPGGDILPVLLPPNRQDPNAPRKTGFALYDTKAGKQLLMLPIQSGSKLDDYNPQWTADGRFLYYVDSERDAAPDGSMRYKQITRIWDHKKSVEHAIIEDVVPVGPGPGKSAMVLKYKGGDCKIHDPSTSKTSPLLNSETRIINAQGRFLLYVKKDKEGVDAVYRGEIK